MEGAELGLPGSGVPAAVNAWDAVTEESLAVREGVGLIETTNFAKYEFTGPGTRDFLDGILTNRLPQPGRIVLSPMLNPDGRLIGDFTVAGLRGRTPPTRSRSGHVQTGRPGARGRCCGAHSQGT